MIIRTDKEFKLFYKLIDSIPAGSGLDIYLSRGIRFRTKDEWTIIETKHGIGALYEERNSSLSKCIEQVLNRRKELKLK
jgi:hypothetical protein